MSTMDHGQGECACGVGHGEGMELGSAGTDTLSGFERIVFQIIRDGKSGIMKKISAYDVKHIMGGGWTETTLSLSFAIHQLFDMEFQKIKAEAQGDGAVSAKKLLEAIFEETMAQMSSYARLCRFLEAKGVIIDARFLEEAHDEGDDQLVSHEDGRKANLAAPGNSEDETWDSDGWRKFQKEGNLVDLRGGMAENYVVKKSFYDKSAALKKIERRYAEDAEDEAASCFEAVRGGAGGSAATARKKQLKEVVKEMQEMVNALPETQDSSTNEDEVVDKIMKDLTVLTEAWKERRPEKDQMKIRLSHLAERLDKTLKASASTSTATGSAPKQSFYNGFQSLDLKAEVKYEGKSSGKSGGKGKKSSGKSEVMKSLPRFDLRRIFPMKQVTSWMLTLRELEQGRVPEGQVAICDSIGRIIEMQALTKEHEITKVITLVAQYDGKEELSNIPGAKDCLLPFQGNLAVMRAVIATTTGAEAGVEGQKPSEAKDIANAAEKRTPLRVVVVCKYLDDELKEKVKQYPDFSMNLLGCLQKDLKEFKTYQWSFDEDEQILAGYCAVLPSQIKLLLSLSGNGGTFVTELKQNIVTRPPVTWYAKEKEETELQFFNRIKKIGEDEAVALAWRRGGGHCLGILKEDAVERNRSWIVFGIPRSWGPVSMKEWLVSNGWTVTNNPIPPGGRNSTWSFQGQLPGKPTQLEFSYVLFPARDGKDAKYVQVRRWEKVRKVENHVTKISGPKWWSKDNLHEKDDPIEDMAVDGDGIVSPTERFQPSIASTELDATMNDEVKRKTEKEIVQPAKKAKAGGKGSAPASKVVGGQPGPGGGTLLDAGGRGDCGWRAAAFMLSQLNHGGKGGKATPEAIMERIEVLAKTLRCKTVTHLVTNKHLWIDSWAPDDQANAVTEAGEPASTPEAFVECLQRPLRWVCGLTLSALAQLQRVNLVIFKFNVEKQDFCIIARFRGEADRWQRLHTVPLVLEKGHYFAMRRNPRSLHWPKEWMNEDDDAPSSQDYYTMEVNKVLRGGVKASCLVTPKKQTKSLDFEDDWLRTCSERSAASSRRTTSAASKKLGSAKSFKPVLKDDKHNKQDDEKNTVQWKCPVCAEVLHINKKKRSDRGAVTKHMQKRHYAIWEKAVDDNKKWGRMQSGYSLMRIAAPIDFVDIPAEKRHLEASFICPYCEMCLPLINTDTRRGSQLAFISKRKHLKVDCTGDHNTTSMRKYHNDFLKTQARFLRKNRVRKGTEDRLQPRFEYAEKNGHEPVMVKVDWKQIGKRGSNSVVCKKCRLEVGHRGKDKAHLHCIGEPDSDPCVPSIDFWRAARISQNIEGVKEALGLNDLEVQKILEDVDAAYESKLARKAKRKEKKSKAMKAKQVLTMPLSIARRLH